MKRIKPLPVAWALGSLIALSFTLCVVWGLIVPANWQMYPAWERLLPGFNWITWKDFFLGFFESFLYGFYLSYVFIPLYNLFSPSVSNQKA